MTMARENSCDEFKCSRSAMRMRRHESMKDESMKDDSASEVRFNEQTTLGEKCLRATQALTS
jgi:hypothetical protein